MPFHLDYTLSHPPKGQIPNPPGYLPSTQSKDVSKTAAAAQPVDIAMKNRKSTELKMRRAWDLALSPAKSLPMQAIMLYFSGSGIQIFSLGMIFTLLTSPITAVGNIFKAFEAFRPTPTTSDKAVGQPSYAPLIPMMVVYIACQGLVLSLGLWKCWTMGVLPTGSADWLQFETRLDPPDWSSVRASSLG